MSLDFSYHFIICSHISYELQYHLACFNCCFFSCIQQAQSSFTRAELHRKSIAQMKVRFHCCSFSFFLIFFLSLFLAIYTSVVYRRSKKVNFVQINNRSIQDMHIFGDPSHVPVVLIEQHVMNVPLHGSAKNLSFNSLNQNDSTVMPKSRGDRAVPNSKKKGRLLKVVVFVHGFQVYSVTEVLFTPYLHF